MGFFTIFSTVISFLSPQGMLASLRSLLQVSDDPPAFMGPDCAVCLCSIGSRTEMLALRCSHVFHKPCVEAWAKHRGSTCPLCRDSFSPPPPPPSSSSSSSVSLSISHGGGSTIAIFPFAKSRKRDVCWIR
ncbi:hypothetical protein HPP92_019237 [Vanilla planifolia]|uniref:RING-type domain-containing protein n=1 Tax=Vanilla planifolia TaxID=51239 RepID=A0A835UJ83_VANPL|nr:hypothetical protein HPP92_019771 [Vanilla planifolia]KAG0465073.1 hypothetical protein HPP92_019237 [Vanilla planifolia]